MQHTPGRMRFTGPGTREGKRCAWMLTWLTILSCSCEIDQAQGGDVCNVARRGSEELYFSTRRLLKQLDTAVPPEGGSITCAALVRRLDMIKWEDTR